MIRGRKVAQKGTSIKELRDERPKIGLLQRIDSAAFLALSLWPLRHGHNFLTICESRFLCKRPAAATARFVSHPARRVWSSLSPRPAGQFRRYPVSLDDMHLSCSRALAVAMFAFVLTFSSCAHAAVVLSVNYPFIYAIKLWSEALTSMEFLPHQFAAALEPNGTAIGERKVYAPDATGAISNFRYLSSLAFTSPTRTVQSKLDDIVSVKDFGATGNGTTDDTAAIQTACNALYYAGGGTLYFPIGTYALNSNQINCYGHINILGAGRQSVILGRTSANNSGRQITISSCLSKNYTPRCPGASIVIDRTSTGALSAGKFRLMLSNVSGLSIGGTVYMWLGVDPTDKTLPYINMFNTITAINGSVVSFAEPVPENVPDPALSAGSHHVWLPAATAENIRVSNLEFERDSSSGNNGYLALSIQYARNVHVSNLFGDDLGFGLLGLNYGTNYFLNSIRCDNMMYNGAYSVGTGNCVDGWSMRNLSIDDFTASDVNGQAVSFEGQNRGITVDGCSVSARQSNTRFPIFIDFAGNSSSTVVRNCAFAASATSSVFNAVSSTNDNAVLENISMSGNVHTKIVNVQGGLSYNGVQATQVRSWSKTFQLAPNMSRVNFGMPEGWYARVRVYVSTITGITRFALLNNHGGSDYSNLLMGGQAVDISSNSAIPFLGPTSNDPFNNNSDGNPPYSKFTQVSTNGAVPDGAWGRIEIQYFTVTGGTGPPRRN